MDQKNNNNTKEIKVALFGYGEGKKKKKYEIAKARCMQFTKAREQCWNTFDHKGAYDNMYWFYYKDHPKNRNKTCFWEELYEKNCLARTISPGLHRKKDKFCHPSNYDKVWDIYGPTQRSRFVFGVGLENSCTQIRNNLDASLSKYENHINTTKS